jgi:hypothetical protein
MHNDCVRLLWREREEKERERERERVERVLVTFTSARTPAMLIRAAAGPRSPTP